MLPLNNETTLLSSLTSFQSCRFCFTAIFRLHPRLTTEVTDNMPHGTEPEMISVKSGDISFGTTETTADLWARSSNQRTWNISWSNERIVWTNSMTPRAQKQDNETKRERERKKKTPRQTNCKFLALLWGFDLAWTDLTMLKIYCYSSCMSSYHQYGGGSSEQASVVRWSGRPMKERLPFACFVSQFCLFLSWFCRFLWARLCSLQPLRFLCNLRSSRSCQQPRQKVTRLQSLHGRLPITVLF